MTAQSGLRFLEDRWDEAVAAKLDAPELLRYRSNLLGSDLRITNFGGGNTSSKLEQVDPLDGKTKQILWVKGSGGDLGSIKRAGFATLYMDKLLALEKAYRGVDLEDEMVEMYPLCTFGNNPVAASIDTPLHGFLPFPHVDHLHPDWGIALAASANGKIKMEEFNKEFGHKLAWLPWQRPGFELGMMLKKIVAETPGCDGVVLGGHGLFTWGNTQRESYLNTITIIDQLGQFIERHAAAGYKVFGGGTGEGAGGSCGDCGVDHAVSAWRGVAEAAVDWEFFGFAAGAGVCELGAGGEAGAPGDELSRSLYPDEDSADVCQVESGWGACGVEGTDRDSA